MTPINKRGAEAKPTRREKASKTRDAVLVVGPKLGTKDRTSEGLYSDITHRIAEKINSSGLCDFPVEERDVVLALQKLHAEGLVKVAHYDPDDRPLHSVTFLNK